MISRERVRQFRRWRRRRNSHIVPVDCRPRHDLGLRACSCYMCDPHKLEPNKERRAREKQATRRELELAEVT